MTKVCQFEEVAGAVHDKHGRREVLCLICGRKWKTADPLDRSFRTCTAGAPPIPEYGPGTELAAILKAAGAKSDQCGGVCKQWQDQMNRWGVAGCRENRAAIIKRLQEAAYKTWVTEQARIGWSISSEPWFRITDQLGSIIDEAIRRAEVA